MKKHKKAQVYGLSAFIYALAIAIVLIVGMLGLSKEYDSKSEAGMYRFGAVIASKNAEIIKKLMDQERGYTIDKSLFIAGAFGGYSPDVDLVCNDSGHCSFGTCTSSSYFYSCFPNVKGSGFCGVIKNNVVYMGEKYIPRWEYNASGSDWICIPDINFIMNTTFTEYIGSRFVNPPDSFTVALSAAAHMPVGLRYKMELTNWSNSTGIIETKWFSVLNSNGFKLASPQPPEDPLVEYIFKPFIHIYSNTTFFKLYDESKKFVLNSEFKKLMKGENSPIPTVIDEDALWGKKDPSSGTFKTCNTSAPYVQSDYCNMNYSDVPHPFKVLINYSAALNNSPNICIMPDPSKVSSTYPHDCIAYAETSDGYLFIEDFSSSTNPNGWSRQMGDWNVLNGVLSQTGTSSSYSNTNYYVKVLQGSRQTYEWTQKFNVLGSGGAGIYIMVDNPIATGTYTNERNNSYFISEDPQEIAIYSIKNNVLAKVANVSASLSAGEVHNFKVIYQITTYGGVISVYRDGVFEVSWIDSNPISIGSYISLRTSVSSAEFDSIRVYDENANGQLIVRSYGGYCSTSTSTDNDAIKCVLARTINNIDAQYNIGAAKGDSPGPTGSSFGWKYQFRTFNLTFKGTSTPVSFKTYNTSTPGIFPGNCSLTCANATCVGPGVFSSGYKYCNQDVNITGNVTSTVNPTGISCSSRTSGITNVISNVKIVPNASTAASCQAAFNVTLIAQNYSACTTAVKRMSSTNVILKGAITNYTSLYIANLDTSCSYTKTLFTISNGSAYPGDVLTNNGGSTNLSYCEENTRNYTANIPSSTIGIHRGGFICTANTQCNTSGCSDNNVCIPCGGYDANWPAVIPSPVYQHCCVGSTCNAGGVCRLDDWCYNCSHLNQSCCSSGTICDTNLGCNNTPSNKGYCKPCNAISTPTNRVPCCYNTTSRSYYCTGGIGCDNWTIPVPTCYTCGKLTQPCCNSSRCFGDTNVPGVACKSSTCVNCGGIRGNRCCNWALTGGVECISGLECNSSNICSCGMNNEICCNGFDCDSGYGCNTSIDTCYKCGELGETCCPSGCNTSAGVTCDSTNKCVSCGDLDQPCCAGSTCNGVYICYYNGTADKCTVGDECSTRRGKSAWSTQPAGYDCSGKLNDTYGQACCSKNIFAEVLDLGNVWHNRVYNITFSLIIWPPVAGATYHVGVAYSTNPLGPWTSFPSGWTGTCDLGDCEIPLQYQFSDIWTGAKCIEEPVRYIKLYTISSPKAEIWFAKVFAVERTSGCPGPAPP